MPAVTPIASAPQNPARSAFPKIFAPPSQAPSVPRAKVATDTAANQRDDSLLVRGQGRNEILAVVLIDVQVQLAPGPPIAAAMLGHPPFTGAENLQAGAVDHLFI